MKFFTKNSTIASWIITGLVMVLGFSGLAYARISNPPSGGLTSPVGVADGGTGATTFTNNRLLTGNGTGALVDEANLIFNGTSLAIGTTSPAALLHIDAGAATGRVIFDRDAGNPFILSFRTDNLPRWAFRVDGTESGSNTGSDFAVRRYDDAGTYIDSPLTINRSTGTTTVTGIEATNSTSTSKMNIPHGTSPSVAVTGDCALDTTSDQFKCFGASATKVYGNGYVYPGFTYGTSTAWTGTTTQPLGIAIKAEDWKGTQCFTDTGTLGVSFYDGTNRMDYIATASTTANYYNFTTNNAFTAGEKRYVDIGTPTGSPTKLSCTVEKSPTAN